MPQYFRSTPTHFQFTGWIVLDAKGGMRLTRKPPALAANERRCHIKINVPRAVFSMPEFAIDVNMSGDPRAIDTVEITEDVKNALEGAGISAFVTALEVEE